MPPEQRVRMISVPSTRRQQGGNCLVELGSLALLLDFTPVGLGPASNRNYSMDQHLHTSSRWTFHSRFTASINFLQLCPLICTLPFLTARQFLALNCSPTCFQPRPSFTSAVFLDRVSVCTRRSIASHAPRKKRRFNKGETLVTTGLLSRHSKNVPRNPRGVEEK